MPESPFAGFAGIAVFEVTEQCILRFDYLLLRRFVSLLQLFSGSTYPREHVSCGYEEVFLSCSQRLFDAFIFSASHYEVPLPSI